jgi:hypothetical protein
VAARGAARHDHRGRRRRQPGPDAPAGPGRVQDGPLYATVAIVVAAIQVIFAEVYGTRFFTGTAVAIGVGFALRLVAYWRGWRLPTGLDWEPSKIIQRVAKPRGPADPPAPKVR